MQRYLIIIILNHHQNLFKYPTFKKNMYTSTYNYSRIEDENHKVTEKTTLRAKFRFKNDVAPKDRAEIQARLDCNYLEQLHKYMKEIECFSTPLNESSYSCYLVLNKFITVGNNLEVILKRPFFGINLDLNAEFKGKIDSKDIIDLQALNNFILTGKNPKREAVSTEENAIKQEA